MDLKARDLLPKTLCWSMFGMTLFFVAFGACGYLAFGADVSPFITLVSCSSCRMSIRTPDLLFSVDWQSLKRAISALIVADLGQLFVPPTIRGGVDPP